jgi:hypothetical protein
MKNVHYGHCLIGVALGVILLIAFGVSAGTLGFLAVVLLCPLMMLVMMRMMMGGNNAGPAERDKPVDRAQQG